MNATLMLMCMTGSLAVGQPSDVVFKSPNIEVRCDIDYRPEHTRISALVSDVSSDVHGGEYHKPKDRKNYGHPDHDFSRVATTYYHDKSPVGVAFAKYNWFPSMPNQYCADVRLPASMMGLMPLAGAVHLWSEPPIAVLGMEAGTVASYGSWPGQTFHLTGAFARAGEAVAARSGRETPFPFRSGCPRPWRQPSCF